MSKHMTSIGGQALIEGVMMRGPKEYSMAVRKPDGEIIVEKRPINSIIKKIMFFRIPILRGVVSFFESMFVGMKALMFSADFYDIEEEEVKSKKEKEDKKKETTKEEKGDEKESDWMKTAAIWLSVFLGVGFSIVLFMLLPAFIAGLFFNNEMNRIAFNVTEAVVRIALFFGYLLLVSRMKDIQRVFEYHGAEHKVIFTYEAGEELTVENAKKQPRLHPRCGTNFLFIVMIISIIVFSLVSSDKLWIVILQRLILLPLVAGVSYEILKFMGRSKSKIICVLTKPGLWLQLLTTREPDESQLEVAIASLEAVLTGNKEDDKW